jgi:serine/threonine protein kinase
VLALHEATGLPVALRYHCPADDGDGPTAEWLAALRADARALAAVTSVHIASLYEHIEVVLDGRFGVATVREYVEGASLGRLLRRSTLPHPAALALLRAGLLALAAAHAQGVTHRAYVPENLLVDTRGQPRLADFATLPADGPVRPENPPQDWILSDVRSAFAVFVACVVGRTGGAGRLPRRLRGLEEPAAGGAVALLEAVEAVGGAGWGEQWRSRGEQELSRLVARARPRRER